MSPHQKQGNVSVLMHGSNATALRVASLLKQSKNREGRGVTWIAFFVALHVQEHFLDLF